MKNIYLNKRFKEDFPNGEVRIQGKCVYIINKVKVQRGMRNQKADEVLIVGMNFDKFKEKYIYALQEDICNK